MLKTGFQYLSPSLYQQVQNGGLEAIFLVSSWSRDFKILVVLSKITRKWINCLLVRHMKWWSLDYFILFLARRKQAICFIFAAIIEK
ncbi:hypothetical protein KCTC52924_01694 [Arenibacter antarcticus]|nr:hypothetical protein [Arenibacter sp. H213]